MSLYEPSWKQVKKYLERAELERGKVRKHVVADLGVSSSALSAWATDNEQAKLPLPQIQPFARSVGMSECEVVQLVATRLIEENGNKPALDVDLITRLITYLLPQGDEQVLIEMLHEERNRVGFHYRLFDSEDNRAIIRTAIGHVIQKEATAMSEEA